MRKKMKDFVVSRIRKTYDWLLERLPFRRRTQLLRGFGDITPSDEKKSNVCASILSAFEPNIASLQSLLIWERPPLTVLALIILTLLFWIAASWNRRFISVVAWAVLLVYLYRVWVNKIWPEIRVPPEQGEAQCTEEEWTPVHPNYLSVPELLDHINTVWEMVVDFYKTCLKVREVSHARFCIIGSILCFWLACIGCILPGVLLVYIVVLSVCLAPGVMLYVTPAHLQENIAVILHSFTSPDDVPDFGRASNNESDLDEFLPETSAAVLRQLSLPNYSSGKELNTVEEEEEEQNSATNELEANGATHDSEESSLYAGLGAFPSVEEVNESDEDDDLVLADDKNMPKNTKETKMEFVPTHYDEDSETDSDAPFTEGLSFGPVEREPVPSKHADKEQSATKVIPSPSDSDGEFDDFEILEEAEITESAK